MRVIATIVLACTALSANADSMQPVLVTATRTATAPQQVLASVERIDAAALDRLAGGELADALRLQPGIEVARLGGPGQQTSLFLRGTESNHVLVLVDGVRINPGTIGIAAIQNIPPELVERIEIVKGPRSTLYGSDALGGVINVITRRGAAAGSRLQFGAGRYDTLSASLSAGLAGRHGDASLGVSWLDSDGFPTRSGDAAARGYRNRSLTAAARTEVGGVELGARLWHAAGSSEYSDFFVTPVDQDFQNSALALSAAFAPAAAWQTRLMLNRAVDRIDQNQSPDYLHTRRWQLDWQNDIAVSGRHALTAGVVLQREDSGSESFGTGFAAGLDSRMLYLQDQADFGPHRLLLAAGFADHETFGGHATWNAEYGLSLTPDTMVTAAAGSAFRAPDATDLYGFGANPALQPERSRSYELSLRHHGPAGHQFTLSAFRNEIDDLIQYVVTDFSTFAGENRNVERARIDGIEAAWRYQSGDWGGRAAVTLQDPRDLTGGARLLRRAREHLNLGLVRQIGPHELAADVLYAGERRDFGFPAPVSLPAYWLAGVSARIALSRHWTMLARVENLLDEDYELARGYNTMGRSLFVSLRRDFR